MFFHTIQKYDFRGISLNSKTPVELHAFVSYHNVGTTYHDYDRNIQFYLETKSTFKLIENPKYKPAKTTSIGCIETSMNRFTSVLAYRNILEFTVKYKEIAYIKIWNTLRSTVLGLEGNLDTVRKSSECKCIEVEDDFSTQYTAACNELLQYYSAKEVCKFIKYTPFALRNSKFDCSIRKENFNKR